MNLLIVDDERRIREGLGSMVQKNCSFVHTVRYAEDAEDALDQLSREDINFILSDIRMPGMDGLDMVEQIRRDYPGLGIILVTGYDDFSYAKRALELGVSGFLLKPVSAEELQSSLEKAHKDVNEHSQIQLLQQWSDWELREHLIDHRNRLFSMLVEGRFRDGGFDIPLKLFGMEAYTEAWFCIADSRFGLNRIFQEVSQEPGSHMVLLYEGSRHHLLLLGGACWDTLSRQELQEKLLSLSGTSGFPQPEIQKIPLGWYRLDTAYKKLKSRFKSGSTPLVRAAQQCIRTRYGDAGFSLKAAALELHLSASHLSREFKRCTGTSFVEALIEYRVRAAAEELEQAGPAEKIYEIGERNGFKNPHYFSRVFRLHTGYAPKEYRRLQGENDPAG